MSDKKETRLRRARQARLRMRELEVVRLRVPLFPAYLCAGYCS